MVTIAGKVLLEGLPVAGANVQVLVYDEAKDSVVLSSPVVSDTNGRYQFTFSETKEWHQNFSAKTEIMVAAWKDGTDKDISEKHEILGTSLVQYDDEALVILDAIMSDQKDTEYQLAVSSILVKEKEETLYFPEFVCANQAISFHGTPVFTWNEPTDVETENGGTYDDPEKLYYSSLGDRQMIVRGYDKDGVQIVKSLSISVVENTGLNDSLQFDDVSIDKGLAFFSVKNRGVRDNVLNAVLFASSRYVLSKALVFSDDTMYGEITDFSNPNISINLPDTAADTRVVKIEFTGVVDGDIDETVYVFEREVRDYKSLTGDISISLDPNTGLQTAALNISDPDEVNEILWQIIYKSTIVEKIVKVTDVDETALINILYQEYTDPSNTEIEFETLQPGNYDIVAYILNGAGVYFKVVEELFVPGSVPDDQEIVVGDTVTVGCISDHGEVPILKVYRLSRSGYEEILTVPMDNAYDRTFFYEYTVEFDDSFYIFKSANSVVVKRVGIPRGCAIAYAKDKESGRAIPFQLQDFNGNVIDSGDLDDSGFGIYYKVMSENVHGVLAVGNTHKVV